VTRTSPIVIVLLTLAVATLAVAGALAFGLMPQLVGGSPSASPTTPAATGPTSPPTASPSASPSPTPTTPPTPTAQPSPTAPPTGEQSYTVRPGDTLEAISLRFGVSIQAIVAANNLANPDQIFIDQVLIIPAPGTTPGIGDCYLVEMGDTLEEIAYQLGVPTHELAEANDLENPDDIRAGQCLVIPGREPSPSPAVSP
jgi:LysM repeat protein